ncbi:MAG: hypothetical protein KC432_00005 [Thermomicrobiales bacterium]|nr:hypothetical protein [Thermomicrobiales bacterium]
MAGHGAADLASGAGPADARAANHDGAAIVGNLAATAYAGPGRQLRLATQRVLLAWLLRLVPLVLLVVTQAAVVMHGLGVFLVTGVTPELLATPCTHRLVLEERKHQPARRHGAEALRDPAPRTGGVHGP